MGESFGKCDSLTALAAIIQAAREAGDRELERAAHCEIAERLGIVMDFDADTADDST